MPVFLAPMLWSMVSWLFRSVVIQFLVMGVVLVLVTELMPLVMTHVGGFFDPAGFSNVFGAIGSGTWYFLDLFALDIGLPMIISAYVSRFLIRRIPFIG